MMKDMMPDAQTKVDMQTARAGASVDVSAVRDHLHGGREDWREHERIVGIVSKDPTFDKSQRPFMNRTQRYERGLKITNRIYELQEKHGWSPVERTRATSIIDEGVPLNLHDTAFEPVVTSQASPEFLAKYGALIRHRGIIGCYMQTELGHGSNLVALETTATYIPDTQEFEIHSPTLTSCKWWNGALGKTATHGVVQAKLILNGEDHGPHLFVVQLRSLEDHKVMPNISIGDIGPKAFSGWAAIDHGYARFDHYRIPRMNMLSKFAQVTPEGRYVRPPHAKISYGGMLFIRSGMVTVAGWNLAKAATISVRYATVRRQGGKTADGLEQQVINYQSVHYRLLPILARAYVFIKLGDQLSQAFLQTSQQLASGDTSTLTEMHAMTSGLKVLATTAAARDIEVARRAMGGHGFSEFAGLGRLYAQYLPATTYEGDNFVLDGQVVRAAVKAYTKISSSARPSPLDLTPSSRYLHVLMRPQPPPPALEACGWADTAVWVGALEWRAALVVQWHAEREDEGADAGAARRVAGAVVDAFVAAQIGEMIGGVRGSALPERTKEVLEQVYSLYLLTSAEAALVDLLSFGLLRPEASQGKEPASKDPTSGLRAEIAKLCSLLLPEAIGLTDAFGFTDWELDSALGVYDGRVYDALWERAQGEPLNQSEVPSAYQYIKPILERGQRLAKGGGAKL